MDTRGAWPQDSVLGPAGHRRGVRLGQRLGGRRGSVSSRGVPSVLGRMSPSSCHTHFPGAGSRTALFAVTPTNSPGPPLALCLSPACLANCSVQTRAVTCFCSLCQTILCCSQQGWEGRPSSLKERAECCFSSRRSVHLDRLIPWLP